MSNIAVKPIKADQKLLNLIQNKYPGFHPALILAEIAHTSEDEGFKLSAAKSLMPYISPQLKSMEVFGEVKHDHGQLKVSIKPLVEETVIEEIEEIKEVEYYDDGENDLNNY